MKNGEIGTLGAKTDPDSKILYKNWDAIKIYSYRLYVTICYELNICWWLWRNIGEFHFVAKSCFLEIIFQLCNRKRYIFLKILTDILCGSQCPCLQKNLRNPPRDLRLDSKRLHIKITKLFLSGKAHCMQTAVTLSLN